MKTSSNKSYKLTITALFAALSCIATMIIIPIGLENGYINLGDCVVLSSGWVLGPVYGAVAAATGTMLADIFSGYAYYAPATFIIKAVMAVAAYYIYRLIAKKSVISSVIASIISSLISEAVMVSGYFIFESVFLDIGMKAAIADIPGNALQGAAAIIIASILHERLKNINIRKDR